jgi:hypothetical protein
MDRILRILRGGVRAAVLALALVVGLAGKLSAAETAASPGPELAGPAQTPERLPEANNGTAGSLVEMPIAETAPPAKIAKAPAAQHQAGSRQASPLATAEPVEDRSVQLEQVAQQADRRTRHGLELAGRGAHFAARSEFIGALRLVAEGLDAEHKSKAHGRALAAALVAMKEADDFLPGGARLESELDLPAIIATHTTNVLKDNGAKATGLTALRCYLTFAQEQFAAAAGHEVAGSMALHALGKLHSALARKKGTPVAAPESKAVVFYQAALLAYPKNYMSANDLGVLLAQCGRYADAQLMLQRSVSLCPQSTGWRNLAVVYRQLGQAALADLAAGQADLLGRQELARRRTSAPTGNNPVQWIDPQTFAQTSTSIPRSPDVVVPPPVRMARLPAEPGRPAPTGRPEGTTNWTAPPVRPPAAVNRRAPPPPTAPDVYGPAPTPAAAERMSWGEPGYQR